MFNIEGYVQRMQEFTPKLRRFSVKTLEGLGEFVRTDYGCFFVTPQKRFLRVPKNPGYKFHAVDLEFYCKQTLSFSNIFAWKNFFEIFPQDATRMLENFDYNFVHHSVLKDNSSFTLFVFYTSREEFIGFPLTYLPKKLRQSVVSATIDREYYYNFSDNFIKESSQHYKQKLFLYDK